MLRHPSALAALLLALALPAIAVARNVESAEEVVSQINLERGATGLVPLQLHPLLSELAADRATDLAEQGSLTSSTRALSRLSRRMLARGYDAHMWSESSSAGPGCVEARLDAWRRERPDSYARAVLGDFEEIGVGFSWLDGEPLMVLLFALPERTEFYRRAGGLADLAAVRRSLLDATNAVRRKRGRRPLAPQAALDAAAQAHAERMLKEGFYDHVSPDGGRLGGRLAAQGYRARIGAENIAKGLFGPAEVIERWMASRGHRKNLVNKAFREIGHGVAVGDGPDGPAVLWVQVFAVP